MIHYRSDRSNEPIPHEECSTLRLDGVIRQMVNRRSVHLTKSEALALARWLGLTLARPEIPTVAGPDGTPDYLSGDRRQAEADPEQDRDATAANLPAAIRVKALQDGQAAGTSRPAPKASRGGRAKPA